MTKIKRFALERNLFGYAKKLDENTVEIYLIGESKEALNTFKDYVKKRFKKVHS